MNELKTIETMTSLQIAKVTGKPHNDVLKAIRAMEPAWKKVNGGNFSLVGYTDAKKRSNNMKRIQKIERWVLWAVFVAWGFVAFCVLVGDLYPDTTLTAEVLFRFFVGKVNALVHIALCIHLWAKAEAKGWLPRIDLGKEDE